MKCRGVPRYNPRSSKEGISPLDRDCNYGRLENLVEAQSQRPNGSQLFRNKDLRWLAWKHVSDQIKWTVDGNGSYDRQCTIHSWMNSNGSQIMHFWPNFFSLVI